MELAHHFFVVRLLASGCRLLLLYDTCGLMQHLYGRKIQDIPALFNPTSTQIDTHVVLYDAS